MMSFLVSFLGDLIFGALQAILECGPLARAPWSTILTGIIAVACFVVAGGALWAAAMLPAVVFGTLGCLAIAGAWFEHARRGRARVGDV
jgi:hypothetical protein